MSTTKIECRKIVELIKSGVKFYVTYTAQLFIFYTTFNVRDFFENIFLHLTWRYTNADLKICQYLRLHMKIKCWRFCIKTPYFSLLFTLLYFLIYAHVRYLKSLFTNIQKQWYILKIYKLHGQITWELLGLRMRNF